MEKKMLLGIVGKSASGKDTLCSKLCDQIPHVHKVKLDTTRPRRPGETDEAYDFLSPHEMELRAIDQEYVAVVGYRRWFYAVPKDEIDHDFAIGVLSPKMIDTVQKYCRRHDIDCVFVYLDVDLRTRLKHSIARQGRLTFEILRRAVADAIGFINVKNKCHIVL